MPRLLTRFEIGWLYDWDPDTIDYVYRLQLIENNINIENDPDNNEKEKDID